MSRRLSLRARLLLAYTSLILVGFGGLALFAGGQMATTAAQDYERELVAQAGLVARALAEPWEHVLEGEASQAALAQRVAEYGRQVDAHVLLLDHRGRPWLSSDDALPDGELREDPEVDAALNFRAASDNRSSPSGEPWLYAAAPVIEDDDVLGVVRLDTALAATRALVVQRWLVLGGGVLLLALLALLASSWLAASLTRPLAELRDSALQVAEGNLTLRLPAGRTDELGELAASFNHMAERVQEMLDEQRAFASNASHELRTPLTAIRLRSEALRAGDVDPETSQEYIAEIDEEVQRLGQLVEDLLLLSRLDSGRVERDAQQVDPARVARHLLQELAPRAEAKQVTLSLNSASAMPTMTTSLSHLHVVFRNLLDNALKHTPPGGEIRWSLEVSGDTLHAVIADNGRGIAAEDLPHLFERFYRVDKARSRENAGVGLGLSLVKAVVESYGGQVQISSPGLGQGTAVELCWPLGTGPVPPESA